MSRVSSTRTPGSLTLARAGCKRLAPAHSEPRAGRRTGPGTEHGRGPSGVTVPEPGTATSPPARVTNWHTFAGVVLATRNRTERSSSVNAKAAYSALSGSVWQRSESTLPRAPARVSCWRPRRTCRRCWPTSPLTDDERAAVDDGQASLDQLLERLTDGTRYPICVRSSPRSARSTSGFSADTTL